MKDILERRSSRKYRPDQISEDELYRVLEAGMYAPSAMNRQSSVMVVLQDRDEIAHLSRMNEEHGIITSDRGDTGLYVGQVISLIPNHVCTAVNMQNEVYLLEDGRLRREKVAARGMLV